MTITPQQLIALLPLLIVGLTVVVVMLSIAWRRNHFLNAISAGPIRTLAASGIKDFRKMLAHCEAVTPIRRTVTIEDVGNSAAFLCSNLSAGISGEVVHVDGGFNIAAMNELELK